MNKNSHHLPIAVISNTQLLLHFAFSRPVVRLSMFSYVCQPVWICSFTSLFGFVPLFSHWDTHLFYSMSKNFLFSMDFNPLLVMWDANSPNFNICFFFILFMVLYIYFKFNGYISISSLVALEFIVLLLKVLLDYTHVFIDFNIFVLFFTLNWCRIYL